MDLPLGELVIGRSANCGLTIDDPLVSRSHARIIVTDEGASIEDAGSRNGIRVNGRTISGRTPLQDGARFRVGSQELLFRSMEDTIVQPPRRRSTDFMIHCGACGLPYSTDAERCPSCGAELDPDDEEPTTTTEQAWSIELLAETIHRAQAADHSENLERLLVQAQGVLNGVSVTIDRRRLDQLADGAIRYSARKGDLKWAAWALGLYSKRGMAPGLSVGAQVSGLPPSSRTQLAPAFRQVLESLRPSIAGGEQVDEQTMEMLRELSEQGTG